MGIAYFEQEKDLSMIPELKHGLEFLVENPSILDLKEIKKIR